VKFVRLARTSRPAASAGRAVFAALLIACGHGFAAPEDPAAILARADDIKTANNAAFLDLLKQIEGERERLSPLQRDQLDYLKGWQLGYTGQYPAAELALKVVMDRTGDPTLRARARISLLNDQALGSHYEEAYANLSELLESLPTITDTKARNFSYGVAALLYNQAGQYDLALKYADAWLENGDDVATCKAMGQKIEALYKSGKLLDDDPLAKRGIEACQRIGDPVFANAIRTSVASLLIDQGRARDALKLLEPYDAQVLATHSAVAISLSRGLLARCYLLTGDIAKAREYAQGAIDFGIKQAFSKPAADAYGVLYEAAKQQGDFKEALAYHEKYAEANKAYLTDTTAHTLAFQMVNQQVADKKRQIDALNDNNQVLQLRQQVDAKSAETARLYILLLIAVLGSIAWWAYRTKRSQLRFQKLARRDSLTGIFNRQHFLDAATATLQYSAKSAHDACMVVIDLDHFKAVNDSYGHAAGDLALKRTVSIVQAQLRSIDIFGRLGGEEFGILLAECALEAATSRAEAMRAAIEGLCRGDDNIDFPVSASFGIATTKGSGHDLKQLLIDADGALYVAKHQGRNCVAVSRAAR
jgi:diguanylate cyclase (GGDEF)-like protein